MLCAFYLDCNTESCYLCTQNIIHGDIKPDNLLVTSTGNLKIGDFSVSQVFEVVSIILRHCILVNFIILAKK
jgi:serine/threonine protein kinase